MDDGSQKVQDQKNFSADNCGSLRVAADEQARHEKSFGVVRRGKPRKVERRGRTGSGVETAKHAKNAKAREACVYF